MDIGERQTVDAFKCVHLARYISFYVIMLCYITRFVTHVNVFHEVKNRNCGIVSCQLTSERPTIDLQFSFRLSDIIK